MQLHAAHGVVELLLQIANVGRHLRPHIGIGDRGDCAFVFLHLRDHFRGKGNRHAGKNALGHVAHLLLVGRIGEGVDQRHGQRFHAPAGQLAQLRLQRLHVQFVHHRSVGAYTLVRFDGQRQRRDRQALVVDHPSAKAARHEGTGYLQDLPVALGRNQPYLGPRTCQDGVGGHRGPMHHMGDVPGVHVGVATDPVDAVGHADRRVLRRAGDFCGVHLPRLLVNKEQVGKCTAPHPRPSESSCYFSRVYFSSGLRAHGHVGKDSRARQHGRQVAVARAARAASHWFR